MKIELDLSKSYNNYNWNNKKELKEHIELIKKELWTLYDTDLLDTDTKNRLYDLLDMFNDYKVK